MRSHQVWRNLSIKVTVMIMVSWRLWSCLLPTTREPPASRGAAAAWPHPPPPHPLPTPSPRTPENPVFESGNDQSWGI